MHSEGLNFAPILSCKCPAFNSHCEYTTSETNLIRNCMFISFLVSNFFVEIKIVTFSNLNMSISSYNRVRSHIMEYNMACSNMIVNNYRIV